MLLTEPLPGLDDGPGEGVTLRVEGTSEESLRVRSEVVAALTQELGEERSELLQRWGEDWFDGQFGSAESEANVYSVRRAPDGTFDLVVKTGSHQFSVDGSEVFIGYIPAHLRHWFASFDGPTSERTVLDP